MAGEACLFPLLPCKYIGEPNSNLGGGWEEAEWEAVGLVQMGRLLLCVC